MEKSKRFYEEIKPISNLGFGWYELWRFRELFYYYTLRYIKVRYKQTVLGFVWAVLQPMLMMILFTYLFGKKLGVSSGNLPYPVFVLSGLIIWNIFSTGLITASNSIIDNSHIIKKIYFPRLIVPVSAIMVSLFDFLMALIIYLIILFIYKIPVDLFVFSCSLLGGVIITALTTLGVGTFLSALNIKYRDFKYVIPFSVQVLLFMTPVIYPASLVSEGSGTVLMALNPLTCAIGLVRFGLGGPAIDISTIILSCICSLFYVLCGWFYFKKNEPYFSDYV